MRKWKSQEGHFFLILDLSWEKKRWFCSLNGHLARTSKQAELATENLMVSCLLKLDSLSERQDSYNVSVGCSWYVRMRSVFSYAQQCWAPAWLYADGINHLSISICLHLSSEGSFHLSLLWPDNCRCIVSFDTYTWVIAPLSRLVYLVDVCMCVCACACVFVCTWLIPFPKLSIYLASWEEKLFPYWCP